MKIGLNILLIISILLIVCILMICLISYIENRKLVVTEYTIKNRRVPSGFQGFRIAQLSDLHNACFGPANEILFERLKCCEPDIIVVTGDMIVGKPDQDVLFAADTMNALCDIAPVYFSMGNHELRASIYTDTYKDMWETFRNRLDPRIHMLLDRTETYEKNGDRIFFHGLNLTPELYRRWVRTQMPQEYLEQLFGTCDPDSFHIFLAHNPEYFEEYAAWGADITFSGHVHGGMIRIPFLGGVISPLIRIFPRYDKGLFERNGKYMVLSGGLGNHTFKIRVNNVPEIVLVVLNNDRYKYNDDTYEGDQE